MYYYVSDELSPQDSIGSSQSDLWIATKCQSSGEGSLHVYTYHQQECSQARVTFLVRCQTGIKRGHLRYVPVYPDVEVC